MFLGFQNVYITKAELNNNKEMYFILTARVWVFFCVWLVI